MRIKAYQTRSPASRMGMLKRRLDSETAGTAHFVLRIAVYCIGSQLLARRSSFAALVRSCFALKIERIPAASLKP